MHDFAKGLKGEWSRPTGPITVGGHVHAKLAAPR